MRRLSSALLGFARQAGPGSAQTVQAAALDAAPAWECRTAWLRPPPLRAAAAAACATGPAPAVAAACRSSPAAAAHGFHSSSLVAHTADPAPADVASIGRPAERERTCWQCGTQLAGHDLFFCPSCSSVQPTDMDTASDQYFQIFGMEEPVFDLDPQQLEQRYKGLQRLLHPDKFSTASPLEKEYAHQQAAVVNAAYDVLKKPLRRAHYILNHSGYGACEGMTITDPELLMSVMEAREEVEEAGSDRAALQPLLERMQALEASCVQELAEAFAAGDLSHAAELTTQLRYVCRIKEAILDKM